MNCVADSSVDKGMEKLIVEVINIGLDIWRYRDNDCQSVLAFSAEMMVDLMRRCLSEDRDTNKYKIESRAGQLLRPRQHPFSLYGTNNIPLCYTREKCLEGCSGFRNNAIWNAIPRFIIRVAFLLSRYQEIIFMSTRPVADAFGLDLVV